MQFFNILEGFRNREYARHKTSWEQTRLIAHVVALSAGNKIKPTDVIEFIWDKKQVEIPKDIEAEKKRILEKYYPELKNS